MNTHSVEIFLAVLIGYVLFGVCFLITKKNAFRRSSGNNRRAINRVRDRLCELGERVDTLHENQFNLQASFDGLAADIADHESELVILRSALPLPGVGGIETEEGTRQRIFEMFRQLAFHKYEHWVITHCKSGAEVAQFTGLVPAISLKAFGSKLLECEEGTDHRVTVFKRGSPSEEYHLHGSFTFMI